MLPRPIAFGGAADSGMTEAMQKIGDRFGTVCCDMLGLVEQHRHQLTELCRRFEVRRLELFGSGARGDFKDESSDLDFLVAFQREGKLDAADRFLGLLAALEELFGRKIDLVDVSAHRNPYFMADVLRHRELLYAA